MEENWYREYWRQEILDVYNPSLSMQKLYEDSQHLDKFCNFATFKEKVKRTVKKSLPQEDADDAYILLDEICLDIASKNGLTTFVKILLDQGAKTNTVNRTYNRAPIHFATEGGHVDTLEALLAEPTNINLQDTEQHQTALHIAVNRNDEKCAFLLLENGASANIPNIEGLTAIYQAAMNRQCNMVELILKEHWQFLDLDNYWNHNNQTTRELINQNLPGLQSLIENLVPIHNYCDLKYYLKVSDEPNFLNMQIDENFLSIAAELLEIATQNDLREAVTRIVDWLEKKESKEKNLKKKVIPAAHMAVEKGRHVILRKLIKVVPEIINDLIMEACLQLVELTRFRQSNWLKCMKVMLNQEGVNIRDLKDSKSNTPLYYAVKSGYIEAVTLFLNKDCYIGHMNNNKLLLAHIPENTLKNYFNNCSQMTDEWTNKCTIEFNYRCLKPNNVSPTNSYDLMKNHEMQLFEDLVHSKTHKELIKHPLLSSFLYLKWHRIHHFLLANFVLYMVFYFILISYVLLIMRYNNPVNKNKTQLTKNVNSNSTNLNTYQNYSLCTIISIWLIFLIFGEILRFVYNCRYYIKDWTNGLQIVLFGLIVAFLCGPGVETGTAVILLSIWKITIMISQYLRFSISIVMFRTVFHNFVCFFSPYIFVIVVFGMFFHMFYGESDLSPNPVFAYIKTIITLASNPSVISNNITSDSRYSTWFCLVLLIFVNSVVIVLTNILSGLTLTDLVDIRSQAELIELSYRIQLIANFENFACMIGRLMNRYFSKNLSQVCDSFVNRIFLFPNYLKNDKITFWIHDTENFDEESNTPLCHAAKSGHSEVISLFRNQDCYISHNKFNVLPLAYIPKGMLATYFNDCVRIIRRNMLDEITIAYPEGDFTPSLEYISYSDDSDYNDYSDNSDYSDDNNILQYHEWYRISVKRSLRHEMSRFKSRSIRREQLSAHYRYFFTNFVLYMVLYLILNSYVLIMRYNSSSIKNETQLANNITLNNTTDKLNSPTQVQNYLRICIAIISFFLISRDVFRFVCKPRRYVKNWMNGLQIMLFELTIALLCDGKIQTGIVVILLTTWKLMIIISKYPRFFIRNVIFRTVLRNLRYVVSFSPYIFPIAFSMTFHIFYKESDDKVFSHPTYTTINTIIMLTGDFVINKTTFDLHYMWVYLVFVIFVFLMVIVLMMLNVLKISDNLRLIEHIKLNKLIYRIQLIAYFENIIFMISGLIKHFFKNLL